MFANKTLVHKHDTILRPKLIKLFGNKKLMLIFFEDDGLDQVEAVIQ